MVEPVVRRRRIKKRWIFLILIILLVAFIWVRHSGMGAKTHGLPLQAVGVAKAVAGPMPVTLDELGTVTPMATVTVLPQISGYLIDVPFTQGEIVKKGQLIAQIDPRPYQIALEMDEATLEKDSATLAQARSDLARYVRLAAQKSISEQQVSDQEFLVAADLAATKVDQANIASEKLNLIYCHITAPVGGRIGLRLVDVGNYVTASSTTGIAVITTIAPTTVEFSVAQNDLAPVLVRIGQGAQLAATAYASDDVTKLEDGVLTAVDNVVDTSTGMVKLRATYANADNALFPNEFVNVHLLVNTLTNATLVPSPAVQSGAPGSYVYVVNPNNTVKVQPVTTGPTDGTNTVITKGVAPGDTVVVDGVDRLTAGAKVIVPGTAPAGQAATKGKHKHKGKHRHRQGDSAPTASAQQ